MGPGPELEGLDELRQLCLGTEAAYLVGRCRLKPVETHIDSAWN